MKIFAILSFASSLLLSATATAQVPARCDVKQISPGFARAALAGGLSPEFREWLQSPKGQYIEPFKAFDNVWYVGGCWVASWAILTSDGVVLIDTMYEPLADMLVDNIKKAGIKLDNIKYVLMTHGHWDHVGGAAKLKGLLKNARFVMSEKGWYEGAHSPGSRPNVPPWKMLDPDIVVKDGDVITLGESKFAVYETPGHSPGTISFAYDVIDGDKIYHAFTVGGLATGTIRSLEQAEKYVESVKRVERLVGDGARPIAVYLSTHVFISRDLPGTAEALRTRKPGMPNPLVDQAAFLKELEHLHREGEEKVLAEKKAGR